MGQGVEFHHHPEHAERAKRIDWLWLTVNAGTEYKRGKDDHEYEVLPRYDTEDKEGHARRVGATPAIPLAAEYCRSRRDGVMRSDIRRAESEGDEAFKAWAQDVDRGGRDLSSFMGSRLHEALVAGEVWLGIDTPSAERLQGLAHGDPRSTPWATWADSRCVLDHEMVGERCVRVVIESKRTIKRSITEKATEQCRAIEWLPDTFRLFEKDKDGKWQPDGEPRKHGFGRVPWFRFRPLDGESYAARFADLQRSAVQTRSDMVQEQKANTYTRFAFWGVEPSEVSDATGTPAHGFAFQEANGKSERLSGDPAAMRELRENLAADLLEAARRSELSSVAMQRQTSPESGTAIAMRRSELSYLLAGIAERTEEAENRLIRWWAEAAGTPALAEQFAQTRYPRDFGAIAEADRHRLLETLYALDGVPIEVKRAVVAELISTVWRMDTPDREALLEAVEGMESSLASELLRRGRQPGAAGPPALFGGPPGSSPPQPAQPEQAG